MKKLLTTILGVFLAANAFALNAQSNIVYVTIAGQSGSDFNQFFFDVGSYNDQSFNFSFDQSLTGVTPFFRMSTSTSTGRVTWVVVSNANMTVSTTNLTWTIDRTNIPPSRVYQAEVYGIDGSGDIGLSLARGKINVTESLFDTTENTYQLPSITNLADYLTIADAAATYLAFADDFTDMTGLDTNVNYLFYTDGDGTGTWKTDPTTGLLSTQAIHTAAIAYMVTTQATLSAETVLIASTNATQTTQITNLGTTQAVNTAEIALIATTNAAQTTAIDNNATTGAVNTAAISALDTNVFKLSSGGTLGSSGTMTLDAGTVTVADATETNEPVSYGQFQSSLSGNLFAYFTSNKVHYPAITPTNNTYKMASDLPDTAFSGSVTYSATGTYPIAVIYTNLTFTQLQGGQVDVSAWCRENGAGSASHKPELYIYDTVNSNLIEFAETAVAKTVPAGADIVEQTWSIPYDAFLTNNLCMLAMRMKVITLSLTPTVEFFGGNGYSSHFNISIPNDQLTADLAKLDGSRQYTGTMHLGSNSIDQVQDFTVLGNASVASNLTVTGGVGMGTFYASGASTNVGTLNASDFDVTGTSGTSEFNSIRANGTAGAILDLYRNDTTINADDLLAWVRFGGSDGGTLAYGAGIYAYADQVWDKGNSNGAYLVFSTIPVGGAAVDITERLRIQSDGDINLMSNDLVNVQDATILGNASVGTNLSVSGQTTTAKLNGGNGSTAAGDYVFSFGYQNEATNNYAFAIGSQTRGYGVSSFANGYQTIASGENSQASGYRATAAHDASYVWSSDAYFTSVVANSWSAYSSGGFRMYGGDVDHGSNAVQNINTITLTTNTTVIGSGSLNGTNGVFFTINSTNFWILAE